ncbi:MAG: hypothetical protein EOM52_05625 [Clostridia bacterium]|nr:hypothetical protein [Clostridia bacterium]
MSDPDRQNPETAEEKTPVIYASPIKRTWAWVGVAYMVIITFLFTWYLAKAKFINGIGALMLIPALCGAAATAILRYRSGEGKGGLPICILFVVICGALVVINLVIGVPALLANFGGGVQ